MKKCCVDNKTEEKKCFSTSADKVKENKNTSNGSQQVIAVYMTIAW